MQPNEARADKRANLVELLAKELNKGKLILPGFPDILMRVRGALPTRLQRRLDHEDRHGRADR